MYEAYLNDNLFFSTDIPTDALKLTGTSVNLDAGSAGTFTFTVPFCNLAYKSFHRLIDFVDLKRNGETIFSGRVYRIEQLTDTQQRITCEGLLTIFNDSIIRPMKHTGTLQGLIQKFLEQHNSQVESEKQVQLGTITVSDNDVYREYAEHKKTISRLKDLAGSYGGWMSVRRQNGVLYLDWLEAFTDPCTQSVDFGKNILTVTTDESSEGIITVLIPLGARANSATDERITIKSVNAGKDYIEAPQEYIDKYGYVVGVETWEDVTAPANLLQKGTAWLNACLVPRRTIEVTAVDLADAGYDVDSFRIGQKIKVTSKPHGITEEWCDCVSQSLDPLNPTKERIVLGSGIVSYIQEERTREAKVDRSMEDIAVNYTTKAAMQNAVDETLENAQSSITQTAEQIRSEVSANHYTKTETDETTSNLRSSITQTAENILLEVSATYDGEELASRINQSASTVQISAQHINLEGAVTFTSMSAATKGSIATDVETKQQYYLSTSDRSATGGSWQDSVPTWTSGKHIWTRMVTTTTYGNNNTTASYQPSANGMYDYNLNKALADSAAAQNTADAKVNTFAQSSTPTASATGDLWIDTANGNMLKRWNGSSWVQVQDTAIASAATAAGNALAAAKSAVASSRPIYYRSRTGAPQQASTPAANAGDNTDNIWTYAIPKPKNGYSFYQATRYVDGDGNVTFSAITEMSNLSVASQWCSANNATYIDGGSIYTGSITTDKVAANAITAAKIDTADLFSKNLTASNFTITGGKVQITTSSSQDDKIILSYGDYKSRMSPYGFNVRDGSSKYYTTVWSRGVGTKYYYYGDTYSSGTVSTLLEADSYGNGRLNLYNSSGTLKINADGTNGKLTCSAIDCGYIGESGTWVTMPYLAADEIQVYSTGNADIVATRSTNNIALRASNNNTGTAGLVHLATNGAAFKWLCYITDDGTLGGGVTSDRRAKDEVGDLSEAEADAILNGVRPIIYTLKGSRQKVKQAGIYAQDLRDALIGAGIDFRNYLEIIDKEDPDTFYYDLETPEENVTYEIEYIRLVSVLIKGWQMHEARIRELEAMNGI